MNVANTIKARIWERGEKLVIGNKQRIEGSEPVTVCWLVFTPPQVSVNHSLLTNHKQVTEAPYASASAKHCEFDDTLLGHKGANPKGRSHIVTGEGGSVIQ